MLDTLAASVALAANTEELAPLLLPPLGFAAIAASVFVLLGFVVWSFRDVSNRQGAGKSTTTPGSGH